MKKIKCAKCHDRFLKLDMHTRKYFSKKKNCYVDIPKGICLDCSRSSQIYDYRKQGYDVIACATCSQIKTLTEFTQGNIDRYPASHCKQCMVKRQRISYYKNKKYTTKGNKIKGCERLTRLTNCPACGEAKYIEQLKKPHRRTTGSFTLNKPTFQTKCTQCDNKESKERAQKDPKKRREINRRSAIKRGEIMGYDKRFVYEMKVLMRRIINQHQKDMRKQLATLKSERNKFKQGKYKVAECVNCGENYIKWMYCGKLCKPCHEQSQIRSKQEKRTRNHIRKRLHSTATYNTYINRKTLVTKHNHKLECNHCGVELRFNGKQHGNYAHLDHIIPVSEPYRGNHTIQNVQLLCFDCNVNKANTIPDVDIINHINHITNHMKKQIQIGNHSSDIVTILDKIKIIKGNGGYIPKGRYDREP